MQPFEKVERSKGQIILNNFLGGIAWGLGATIGLAVFLAVVGFVVSKIDWVPIVGNLFSQIFEQALKSNPQLR